MKVHVFDCRSLGLSEQRLSKNHQMTVQKILNQTPGGRRTPIFDSHLSKPSDNVLVHKKDDRLTFPVCHREIPTSYRTIDDNLQLLWSYHFPFY